MFKIIFVLSLIIILGVIQAHAESLLTIYQQALQEDPQLRSAQFKVEVGSAQKGQALGQLLPQVSATGNWSENKQVGYVPYGSHKNYPGTRYYVSLTQSVVDFAKFWEWRKSQEVENQYASELIEAQHVLIFSVVQRYFGALDAEDELSLTQQEKQAIENELIQVKKQYAKQLIKVTDLYEIEARLDQIKADEIEAESLLLIAKQSLKELTNNFPNQLDKLRESVEYKELEGNLEDWIAVAKSENPLLVSQLSAIEAARNNVLVQKSRYLMYEAQSRLAMSKEESEAKMRALVKETSDAFSASNANARRIKAAEKALASAVKSREAMQSALKYGVETVGDLLRAQQLEYKAKREFSRSKYEYIINRMRFLKAIGTVNEENLQEVNSWLVM